MPWSLGRVVLWGTEGPERVYALTIQMGSGAKGQGSVQCAGQASADGCDVGTNLVPVLFRSTRVRSGLHLRFRDGLDEFVPIGAKLAVDGDSQWKQVVTSSWESSQILSALRSGCVVDSRAGQLGMAGQAGCAAGVSEGKVDKDGLCS